MKALLLGAILLAAAFPGAAAQHFRADFATGQTAYRDGDYAVAIEQLTVAAERGSATAYTLLGHIFRDGHGGNGRSEAEAYYLQAARRGDCAAQLSLARMYHLGSGKSPDRDSALRWYETAARNGSAWAQLSLASFFDQGTNVEKDNVQAYFWFSILAARLPEIGDSTNASLQEVAIRSLVAVRDRMTAAEFADAMDLLDEQHIDPIGCTSG